MSLSDKFEAAQAKAKVIPGQPTNNELLEMYALFKQGTVGDCTGSRPGAWGEASGRGSADPWAAGPRPPTGETRPTTQACWTSVAGRSAWPSAACRGAATDAQCPARPIALFVGGVAGSVPRLAHGRPSPLGSAWAFLQNSRRGSD